MFSSLSNGVPPAGTVLVSLSSFISFSFNLFLPILLSLTTMFWSTIVNIHFPLIMCSILFLSLFITIRNSVLFLVSCPQPSHYSLCKPIWFSSVFCTHHQIYSYISSRKSSFHICTTELSTYSTSLISFSSTVICYCRIEVSITR